MPEIHLTPQIFHSWRKCSVFRKALKDSPVDIIEFQLLWLFIPAQKNKTK